MYGPDNPKPITADEFTALCARARSVAESRDEYSLLYSLCRTMIEDLGDLGLACPPKSEGTQGLMDLILCDFLIHRYDRENRFDPFPIIQNSLLALAEEEGTDAPTGEGQQ